MLANVTVEFRWFLKQIVAQFGAHGLLDSAASLTYTTLFAVVPLMTVSYTILSMFPDFSTMGQQIQEFVFENFVPASSAVIQERLEDFSHQARDLTIEERIQPSIRDALGGLDRYLGAYPPFLNWGRFFVLDLEKL